MQTENQPHMEVGYRAIEGGSPVVHVVGSALLAGAGLVGVLTGLGLFPMPPLDEPRWFVVWFGAVFVLAGFGKGVRAVPRCVRWLQALSQVRGDPAQAWRIDWPYGTDGVSDGLRAQVWNCYVGVAITAVFAWPVLTHTLVAGEWAWLHWVLFGIVVAVLVAQLWRGIFLTVRLRHRGESYLRFAQCPYFLGEVLQATLVAGRGMAR